MQAPFFARGRAQYGAEKSRESREMAAISGFLCMEKGQGERGLIFFVCCCDF